MLRFSRSNSWATTSTLKPSPWKSPTQTDRRRRNESAWQKRRFRLLPSSAYRHFTLISRETTSPLLIHEDIASAMGYGPLFPIPKNSDAHTHFQYWWTANSWTNEAQLFPTEMCFIVRTGATQAHTVHKNTHGRTIFCCNAEMRQVFHTWECISCLGGGGGGTFQITFQIEIMILIWLIFSQKHQN